jgi:hypothetical protein
MPDKVTVYSYRCWNDESGTYRLGEGKATLAALERMTRCTPIPGSGELVGRSHVEADGVYRLPSSGGGSPRRPPL